MLLRLFSIASICWTRRTFLIKTWSRGVHHSASQSGQKKENSSMQCHIGTPSNKSTPKLFSFNESQKLPGAALIHTLAQLQQWEQKTEGPKVLKSCFGVSGRGHLFLPSLHMKKFAEKEFAEGRPVIAEPWVERKLDFSTQWMIHQDQKIEYLGATICVNDHRGQYIRIESAIFLFFLENIFRFLKSTKNTSYRFCKKWQRLGILAM